MPKVALKGQSVAFNCTADGNPNPTYSWLKDGKPVGSKQTFCIENVSYASEGVYVCVANNTIESGWRTGKASAAMKVEGIVIVLFEIDDRSLYLCARPPVCCRSSRELQHIERSQLRELFYYVECDVFQWQFSYHGVSAVLQENILI